MQKAAFSCYTLVRLLCHFEWNNTPLTNSNFELIYDSKCFGIHKHISTISLSVLYIR